MYKLKIVALSSIVKIIWKTQDKIMEKCMITQYSNQ
jgi:hypothetical protein